jgi:hypothetical protein
LLLRSPSSTALCSVPSGCAPHHCASSQALRRSQLQRCIKHAVATQAALKQVAALKFDEPALYLSNGSLGDSSEESESESIESTTEILMADNFEHRV